MSARALVLLFSLLACTAALDCYMGEWFKDWHEGNCENGETLCYKTSSGSGDTLKETYGCDSTNMCANAQPKSNCFNMNGAGTCCCDSTLCNTPSKVSSVTGLPLILIGVIGLFVVSV